MPRVDFRRKRNIYAHHLTVPHRSPVPDPEKVPLATAQRGQAARFGRQRFGRAGARCCVLRRRMDVGHSDELHELRMPYPTSRRT